MQAPIGIVYVKELPATLSPTDIFKNLPFTLRFVQKTNGKNKYEASISSSRFPSDQLPSLILGHLRPLVASM